MKNNSQATQLLVQLEHSLRFRDAENERMKQGIPIDRMFKSRV